MRKIFACLLLAACAPWAARAAEIDVLSLNIWHSEGTASGRESIASLIRASGAQVVGVQELNSERRGAELQRALGAGWHYRRHGDTGWYSRYPILAQSPRGQGVQLQAGDGRLWVFNAHLVHHPYGPYQLAGIAYMDAPLRDPADPAALRAVRADQAPRLREAEALLADMRAAGALEPGAATVLLGDFNEPSALDWTAEAHAAGLHPATLDWPSAQVFLSAGLRDGWRSLHPDPLRQPGNTWSPRLGAEYREAGYPAGVHEPQDRIDWVLYAGPLRPLRAELIGPVGDRGASRFHGHGIGAGAGQYPSDHRGVLLRFRYEASAAASSAPAGVLK